VVRIAHRDGRAGHGANRAAEHRAFRVFADDLAGDRALAEALCDQITELKIRYWGRALDVVGDQVDVILEEIENEDGQIELSKEKADRQP